MQKQLYIAIFIFGLDVVLDFGIYLVNRGTGVQHHKTARAVVTPFFGPLVGFEPAVITHQKIKLQYCFTDGNYWQINDFDFVEGKSYTNQNLANNDYVAVINEDTRDRYFGKGIPAVGKTLEVNNITYRIIGVVRGCPIFRRFTSADVFLPYTTTKSDYKSAPLMGPFAALILAKNTNDLPRIKEEFQSLLTKVTLNDMKQGDYQPDQLTCHADTFLGSLLYNLKHTFGIEGDGDSAIVYFYLVLVGFALLFMSLPALNLVNINLSRIMERASEIGIRKAFGASTKTLTMQFVIENVIITLLGGLLSLLFSEALLFYINQSGLIPYIDLVINFKVFLIAIAISVVFGLLSGVYPAWRMSKLQIVEALKQ